MSHGEIRVAREPLQKFVAEIFIQAGMPSEDAETEAEALLWANLRGVDSHGVSLIPWYIGNVDNGVMNIKPDIRVIKETPATCLIEADRAFGPVVTTFAMNLVIEKAKEVGIGWAIIRDLTHQGALGYYSLMAAERNMAGIVFTSGRPTMAPYGAKASGISNAPISIAVPSKRHQPLLLDMATSIGAIGKIWLAIDKGVSIPSDWALDKDGNPTTDPGQAAIMMPVGGPKGSGLSIMVECLTSVIANSPILERALSDKEAFGRHIQSGVVAAIDISTFCDPNIYQEHIDNLIDALKALPKAEGFTEISVPGERSGKTIADRRRNGIPLSEGIVRKLQVIATRFNIQSPFGA